MQRAYPVEAYLPEFIDRQRLLQGALSLDQTVPVKTEIAVHHLYTHTSDQSLLTNPRLLSEAYAKQTIWPHQRFLRLRNALRDLNPISRACMGCHLWTFASLSHQGDRR